MHGSNLVLPKCVCNNYQRQCMQIDSMLLWVSSLMDHRPDVKMWLKKKVAYEAHLSVWCSYHILTSGLWSITEQTYGNMEPIGMHRRWCTQFSSKRLSSNTSSVGTNKSASKILHMHIFGGSAQTVPKVPTILCNRNWLRCSEWPSVPSWICRTVIRIIIKHPCASTFYNAFRMSSYKRRHFCFL